MKCEKERVLGKRKGEMVSKDDKAEILMSKALNEDLNFLSLSFQNTTENKTHRQCIRCKRSIPQMYRSRYCSLLCGIRAASTSLYHAVEHELGMLCLA